MFPGADQLNSDSESDFGSDSDLEIPDLGKVSSMAFGAHHPDPEPKKVVRGKERRKLSNSATIDPENFSFKSSLIAKK